MRSSVEPALPVTRHAAAAGAEAASRRSARCRSRRDRRRRGEAEVDARRARRRSSAARSPTPSPRGARLPAALARPSASCASTDEARSTALPLRRCRSPRRCAARRRVRLRTENLPVDLRRARRGRAPSPAMSADSQRDVLVDEVGRGAGEAAPTARRSRRESVTSARSMPLASTRNSGATCERSGETTLSVAGEKPVGADRRDRRRRGSRRPRRARSSSTRAPSSPAESRAEPATGAPSSVPESSASPAVSAARRRCRRSAPWRRRAAGPSARSLSPLASASTCGAARVPVTRAVIVAPRRRRAA